MNHAVSSDPASEVAPLKQRRVWAMMRFELEQLLPLFSNCFDGEVDDERTRVLRVRAVFLRFELT